MAGYAAARRRPNRAHRPALDLSAVSRRILCPVACLLSPVSCLLNLAILKKCLVEVRLLFAAMAALLFSFCWVRVFIVSRLQTSQFAAIIEQVWDQFKDFSPVPLD